MAGVLTAAALVAALGTASAQGVSYKVEAAGKSPAELRQIVWKVADRACRAEAQGVVKLRDAHRACVRNTTEAALRQGPAPTAAD